MMIETEGVQVCSPKSKIANDERHRRSVRRNASRYAHSDRKLRYRLLTTLRFIGSVGKTFVLQSIGTAVNNDGGEAGKYAYNSPTLGEIQLQKENDATIVRNVDPRDCHRWVVGAVLCFSLNDRASLDALLDVIVPRMRASSLINERTPMFLLGLLDADRRQRPRISSAAVDQMHRWLGGVGCAELSLGDPPDHVAGVLDFGPFQRFRALYKKRIVPRPLPPPRPPVPRIDVPPLTTEASLAADLRQLLADGAFSDVELVVAGDAARFKAHRAVLCIGSKVWRAVFGVESSDKAGAYDDVVASLRERQSKSGDGCASFTVTLRPAASAALVREMLDAIYGDSAPSAECVALFRLADLSSGEKAQWIERNLYFHDAVICTDDGTEFRAQRALLHARSGFFARLLGGPFVEAQPKAGVVRLSLSGVESEAVAQCVRYLLVRHVDISDRERHRAAGAGAAT
jgi:hypothetical protein